MQIDAGTYDMGDAGVPTTTIVNALGNLSVVCSTDSIVDVQHDVAELCPSVSMKKAHLSVPR